MTSARIQSFCRKYIVIIGSFIGKETTPRSITQRVIALLIYNNPFCSVWKSHIISINQAIKGD